MGAKGFDYGKLPFEEIGRLYRDGWGWKAIAAHYGAPDHKTLAKHAKRRLPGLEVRDHAQAQQARRAREGTSSRQSGAKKRRRPWWLGGGEG